MFSRRAQGKDLNFSSQPTLREFPSWREGACQPRGVSECLEKGSADQEEHRVPPTPLLSSKHHCCSPLCHLVRVVLTGPYFSLVLTCEERDIWCIVPMLVLALGFISDCQREALQRSSYTASIKWFRNCYVPMCIEIYIKNITHVVSP